MAVFDIDMTLLNNTQRYRDAKRAGVIDKDSKPKRKTKFETPGKAFKRSQEFLFDSARLDKDKVIPGTLDFINSLMEQGYIIAYCTARRLTFYEATKRQLEKKGFPLMMDDMGSELLFMKRGGSDTSATYKQKTVLSLSSSYDVRFFFDDLVDNLQAVSQVGVPGLYPSIKAYTDLSTKSNPAPNCGCGKTPCVTYGTRSNPEEYSENYMVPRDIHRLGKAADRLEETYEDGQEAPEWWKSKLSVAAKDTDSLADSLDYVADNPRKNPSHSKKVEKGKKLYKHMNGKEPEKITKQKIDMGDVWYQVGEGGCWQIGYMSGKETGSSNQKYTHTFNEETQDGNFPKLYATMPENGKPLLIIQGGTWKIRTDDKGVAWIYD